VRTLLLLADAVFGLALLTVAFAGRLTLPSPSAPAPRIANEPIPQLVTEYGRLMPPGQSTGFAVARDGSLAVVDRGRQAIMRLDSNGREQAEWTIDGAIDLVGIAEDVPGGGWDVLDRGALRIVHLDDQGRPQPSRSIDLSKLETYGPNGLAVDPGSGNLLMADTGRDRLVVFASTGAMSATLGNAGTDLGKFKQPMFLAFAPDGSFFVTDWENSRIQHFGADGAPINAWPVPVHAWGITVDGLGRVFVPDGDHHLVRMYGPDGSLLAQIGAAAATALPIDGASQVGISPDGAWLWVLGSDGLARVDLAPFAQLRPAASPQAVRTPLAVLGAVLLVLAAVVGAAPHVRSPKRSTQPIAPPPAPGPRRAATPPSGAQARIAPVLLALGATGAVIAGLILLDSDAAKENPWPRMAALLLTCLVFAAGAIWTRPWRWVLAEWPACSGEYVEPATRAAVIVVPVAILATVAGYMWWQGRFQTSDATRAAFIWLAALAITAGALIDTVRFRRPSLWTLVPWLLFAAALVPRAWNNANMPYGVWFDEAEAGVQARKFLQSGLYTPITDTYGRDASLFYYGISAAQAAIPDPVLAGRLVAAVVGAACAPLAFFLGRELFGWPVGLAAGAILASQRWHLDVSRLGWDPISLPFFALLAFWLLARATRSGRWRDVVWAGLAFGLGMHGYIGFRVLPLVALVLVFYAGWRRHWPPMPFAGRVVAFSAAAALAALPVIIFAIQDPAAFNGRFAQTLIFNEPVAPQQKVDELWSNLQKHALMFHVSGDMNGRHNLPGAPMLDPVSGLAVVVGLAVRLVRPFDWRSWLLFGWAASSMAGGILTIPYEAPQAMRTLGVTPVLALLAGLGLVVALDRGLAFIRANDRWVPRAGTAAAAVALSVIAAFNFTTFFGKQMSDPVVWESFSTRETLPSRAAEEAPTPFEAILGSQTIAPSVQQQLMVPTIQNTIRTFDSSTDLPYRGNGPALVVLEAEHDTGLADEVARYYPDAPRQPMLPSNSTHPTAYEIHLDRNVIAAHRGLAASRQPDGSYRADLTVDVQGAYAFQVSPGSSATIDGQNVATDEPLLLVPGNHLLEARLPDGTEILQWRPPAATSYQPIDDARLFSAPPGGNGLLATFYPTQDFQGTPTASIIDPTLAHYYHLSPFSRLNMSPSIWSAEWLGSIEVPTAGTYRFEADRLSRAGLWIDSNVLFDDTPEGADDIQVGSAVLTAGRHAIRVRLQNRGDAGSRLYLYWTPPGGTRTLVSGQVLYPPSS
jgi:PA14 domain/Dolichyl-phosphate-mannose-protein mannosyltransferase